MGLCDFNKKYEDSIKTPQIQWNVLLALCIYCTWDQM